MGEEGWREGRERGGDGGVEDILVLRAFLSSLYLVAYALPRDFQTLDSLACAALLDIYHTQRTLIKRKRKKKTRQEILEGDLQQRKEYIRDDRSS